MSLIDVRERMLKLQHECAYCCSCLRQEKMVASYDSIKIITDNITELLSFIMSNGEEYSNNDFIQGVPSILQEIITAQTNYNLSRLADILEEKLITLLAEEVIDITEKVSLERISFYEKNIGALEDKGYADVVEILNIFTDTKEKTANEVVPITSKTGDICFAVKPGNSSEFIYTSGLSHPYKDALEYAFANRKDEITEYAMAGIGMIYEALAMLRLNYGTPVIIIEQNMVFARKVLTYIDVSEYIEAGRLLFVLGHCDEALSKHIAKESLFTKMDAMITFDEKIRTVINKQRSITLPIRENKQILAYNFITNAKRGDPYVSELKSDIENKEVYLVAGGPSLTPCIPLLKKRAADSVIFCVGTSATKLMHEGIVPDYVILLDGLPAIRKQFDPNFDYSKTRLIYAATACFEFVELFKGKRYIAYQEAYDLSEKKARELGRQLFKTGGSVSTLALDLAVKLGVCKIVCLGLDLAYTYNQLHASGIDDVKKSNSGEFTLSVMNTSGRSINTSYGLNSFKIWIERYLSEERNLPDIVNISDGAYIEGMQNITVEAADKP